MPKLQRYTYNGPVDNTVLPDKSQLKGKSVIVTGGEYLRDERSAKVSLLTLHRCERHRRGTGTRPGSCRVRF
jgi:hypothetical protein